MSDKIYSLKDLGGVNTDAWVEAISWVSETEDGRVICPEDECPAEHEHALTALSDEKGFRFHADGSFAGYSVQGLERASEEADAKCGCGSDAVAVKAAAEALSAWSDAIHFIAATGKGAEICPEGESPADYVDELYGLADEIGYVFNDKGEPVKGGK